jgi:RNA polymerase sigma factor (sigma-70 family)
MSHEGFKQRIAPIKNKLFRFACRIIADRTEAEDIVQEVCIKLWRQWDRIDEIDNLEAWSMRLTKNLSIDKLRSKHRRTHNIEQAFHLQVDTQTPYEVTAGNDTVSHIRQLMEALPEKQRLVMHLRDIEGLSYQEICEALQLPMGQVKVNLFRARKQVRAQLLKSTSYGS